MMDLTDGVPVSRLSSADGRRALSGAQVELSFGDQAATVVEAALCARTRWGTDHCLTATGFTNGAPVLGDRA